MRTRNRVTVVNDHPEFLNLLMEFLSEEGYKVTSIPKHQGAFEQLKSSQPDVVICDLIFDNMPAGWAFLDLLYLDPATRPIPVILTSAKTREVEKALPKFAGKGIHWLEKPFELQNLLDLIEYLNGREHINFRQSTEPSSIHVDIWQNREM